MTTKKRQITNRHFVQLFILFALGFSIADCTNINPDIFSYPDAKLYEGNDVGSLWRMVLPPSGGILTTYEGKAYTTTSSLDEILLYYQRSLSEWNYLGQGPIDERTIKAALWEKNDDKVGIYYLTLPDRPCCFLLVMHTHFQRPLITNPFLYLGLLIILLAPLLIIFRKRLQKE
jgi:hypothetical protein